MCESICGADCGNCYFKENCGGCVKTQGSPFGKKCFLAVCCQNKKTKSCSDCSDCGLRKPIIDEFNALKIADAEIITSLNALKGEFINIEYTSQDGKKFKLLDDNKIYLGAQVHKNGSDRCYGFAADESMLVVCEYGCNGDSPELIVYKKRKI